MTTGPRFGEDRRDGLGFRLAKDRRGEWVFGWSEQEYVAPGEVGKDWQRRADSSEHVPIIFKRERGRFGLGLY